MKFMVTTIVVGMLVCMASPTVVAQQLTAAVPQRTAENVSAAALDTIQPDMSEDTQPAAVDAKSLTPTDWWKPEQLQGTLRTMTAVGILSLAPAALLMTTSFIRLSIVLGLLRQAIGSPNLPSNQVLATLAMCLTLLVMYPTWMRVYQDSIVPYTDPAGTMTWQEAWQRGVHPIRDFMSGQIEARGNAEDVLLFVDYLESQGAGSPRTYEDVPLPALLPAFILSELKTAFLIGFQIFLPFLIVDMVVASVTTSIGMMMLPPAIVSLPLKLLLFVLADGWRLVIGMSLESFLIAP